MSVHSLTFLTRHRREKMSKAVKKIFDLLMIIAAILVMAYVLASSFILGTASADEAASGQTFSFQHAIVSK